MAVNITLRKNKAGNGNFPNAQGRVGWAELSCDSDEWNWNTALFYLCVCSTWVIRMSCLLADDARLVVTFLISLTNTEINDTALKQFLIIVAIGKHIAILWENLHTVCSPMFFSGESESILQKIVELLWESCRTMLCSHWMFWMAFHPYGLISSHLIF